MKHHFHVNFLLHAPGALLHFIISVLVLLDCLLPLVFPVQLETPGATSDLLPLIPVHLNPEGREERRKGGRKGEIGSFVLELFSFWVCVEQVQAVLESLSQLLLPPHSTSCLFCLPTPHWGGMGAGKHSSSFICLLTPCGPQFRNDCFEVEFVLFQSLYESY